MNTHKAQIEAIQTMLVAGHRSVHLERHSLLLLGGMGGFLSVVTEWFITAERFPDSGQRGVALLAWLAFWLVSVALVEHRLTRRARLLRSETLPFAQAQVTRAWWMLMTLGCLGSFAMFFHGGGSMTYALWTVLLGLGMYFYGLFSRPLLEWIGLAAILLGVVGLAAGLPYGATRWLNASCFAIGMPLAGWLNARMDETANSRLVMALTLWLTAVAAPPMLLTHYATTSAPAVLATPLGSVIGSGEQVVHLPAGTQVPLRLDMESPILAISPNAGLEMTLSQPLDVSLLDGRPDGRYRLGKGDWHAISDGVLRLRIDQLKPSLMVGGAEVRVHAVFDGAEFRQFNGDKP